MARRYRNYYPRVSNDDRLALGCALFIVFGVIPYIILNKELFKGIFIICLIGGILIAGLFYYLRKLSTEQQKKDYQNAYEKFANIGGWELLNSFIAKFGYEGNKESYKFRDYRFDWGRLRDFRKLLEEKGASLNDDHFYGFLREAIQKKEENLIRSSLTVPQQKFKILSGSRFEALLSRLFESMGYAVQRTGKTGDQGCDLILNLPEQDRLLIQAKCYNEAPVGNSAIQEAVAAQKLYDCPKAMVVTNSDFTREAITLAKVNSIELINKTKLTELLQQYLNESWS
jgi:HJR/Mrr/RecB family endonuclease